MTSLLISICLVVATTITDVASHGRLIQPPGRSSAWRYGFGTPTNYNDHEIYCGGFSRQYSINKGKCGPCGDAYDSPQPRDNENGGKYGRGVIVKKYVKGEPVELGVELTANHYGYFEFRLCAHNAPSIPEDEKCFEKNFLKRSDGKGNRYYPSAGSRKFLVMYNLPEDVTCKQCVLQWRYIAGNNWGRCSNGTGMVGCGPQEEFRSCADIQISEKDGSADDVPSRVPELPQDEPEYNEIDVDSQKDDEIHTIEQSHAGQIAAIVLAFVIVIIGMLFLTCFYFWNKGTLKTLIRKKRSNWPLILTPTSIMNSLKMSKPLPSLRKFPTPIPKPLGGPPPVPPRRHRHAKGVNFTSTTPIAPPILSISSPTKVAINGIEVHSNPTSNFNPNLYVPSSNNCYNSESYNITTTTTNSFPTT